MKRFFKKLIDFFEPWLEIMSWKEKVSFGIGGLFGIVIAIMVFVSIDKVPAKEIDYQILEQIAFEVQTNPGLLLDTNCNINITDDNITIRYENKECKVYATYNKNFRLISASRMDKYTFWLWAVCIAILIGLFVYATVTIVLTMVISIIYFIIEVKRKK